MFWHFTNRQKVVARLETIEITKKVCWSSLRAKIADIFNREIVFCSLKTYITSILQTGQ